MKILFLTQYYPPEIGAPQNRLHELAIRLQKAGINVEVLTAMPNYPKMEIYAAYKNSKIKEEIIDGIIVHRSSIYVSKSKSILPRLLNYFSFVISSYWRGKNLKKSFDYLLVESPPLFLAYSAMALSRKLKTKLIFNVSDLWPESAEKLGIVKNKFLLNIAYRLEKKAYLRSHFITGQTNGIVENIRKRFPEKKVYWLPNGVDLSFYNPEKILDSSFRQENHFEENDLLFFYGGIIGHAQGLEIVLNAAQKISIPNVKLILQGSGPEKERLLALKNKLTLNNVFFLEPKSKSEMPFVLKAIDVAVVPLKKLDIFQGAIPSKIFESCAMEKPLLLGVEGEAKQHFIDNATAGIFYEPENVDSFVQAVELFYNKQSELKIMGKNARSYVSTYFDRNKIAEDFIHFLNSNG
ncbi:MAG: glycosyltransferase family 4 protein [Flavobacteriia bacterium]|nr:glycosyltransferase family 4 protein [Flavobacteriia bacterium]